MSHRQWNIIIGSWIYRSISYIVYRHEIIQRAFKYKKIISTNTYIENENNSLLKNNTLSFVKACDNEVWINILDGRIIKLIKPKNFKQNFINSGVKIHKEDFNVKHKLKFYLNHFLSEICSQFTKNSNAVIFDSYLSYIDEIKLNLKLKQIPRRYLTPIIDHEIPRNRDYLPLINKIFSDKKQSLLNQLLPILIPSSFVEDFKKINNIVNLLGLKNQSLFLRPMLMILMKFLKFGFQKK